MTQIILWHDIYMEDSPLLDNIPQDLRSQHITEASDFINNNILGIATN